MRLYCWESILWAEGKGVLRSIRESQKNRKGHNGNRRKKMAGMANLSGNRKENSWPSKGRDFSHIYFRQKPETFQRLGYLLLRFSFACIRSSSFKSGVAKKTVSLPITLTPNKLRILRVKSSWILHLFISAQPWKNCSDVALPPQFHLSLLPNYYRGYCRVTPTPTWIV